MTKCNFKREDYRDEFLLNVQNDQNLYTGKEKVTNMDT